MASKSMFICLVFLVVLCLVLMGEASDCSTSYGCFFAKVAVSSKTQNRKVLGGLKEKKEAENGLHGSAASGNGGNFVGWELRTVPSGPDPLHHNGGSPKKPRTP